MDKIVEASAYVIKMIKQQEAAGFPIKNIPKCFSAIVCAPSFQDLFVN